MTREPTSAETEPLLVSTTPAPEHRYLESLHMDASRPSYVFGTGQVVKAEALQSRQIGAMLFRGSVDVRCPAYLGTYTFRASPDARGTFRIRLSGARQSTFLLDSGGRAIAWCPGKAATITAVAPAPERIDKTVGGPQAR